MTDMYGGFRPQDDLGHSIEDDSGNYQPGMGAMVAMGYEPGTSGFEAFDMGHTWSPDMLPGMPHGPFDEPDKMGWEWAERRRAERERHPHHRGFWARLFGLGDRFGDDDTDASIYPQAQDYVTEDYVTEEYVPVETYAYGGYRPRRPAGPAGWAAWQRPHSPVGRMARRR
ncbi:MAG: hypothetical protein ACHREM_16670 [Polyangiales bacterium]